MSRSMSAQAAAAHLLDMTNQPTPTLTYAKAADTSGAMTMRTYKVLLDGRAVGTVSKVRDHYLRRLGGHRGNNVPAARDAWRRSESQVNFDTRSEAVIDLLADTHMSRVEAMNLVRGTA